jgi:hypothetical protein
MQSVGVLVICRTPVQLRVDFPLLCSYSGCLQLLADVESS